VEGSCLSACNTSARALLPAHGLPFDSANPNASDFVVAYLSDAYRWFLSAIQKPTVDSLADFERLLLFAAIDFMQAPQLQYALGAIAATAPGYNATARPRLVPEDFVRAFVLAEDNPYNLFCPTDAAIFANGVSFPGCICMTVPSTYQDNAYLMSGTSRSWVDVLQATNPNSTSAIAGVRACVCVRACMRVHACVRVCVSMCVCVCVSRFYECVCVHVHVHAFL
jgi:hypothetical protein